MTSSASTSTRIDLNAIAPIQRAKAGEQSANIANLHIALQALGFSVDAGELKDKVAGNSTVAAVRAFQKSANLTAPSDTLVDEATAAALNGAMEKARAAVVIPEVTYLVEGTVSGPNGQPARGLAVAAFNQDLRTRQSLGLATTDSNGQYKIYFSPAQFTGAESDRPDLVIEVYAVNQEVLGRSDVVFEAPLVCRIDVSLTQLDPEAEFDRIVRMVRPLLEGQNVTVDTLEENNTYHDLTFLSQECGFSVDILTDFAVAQRVPKSTELPPEFWFGILATKAISTTLLPSGSATTLSSSDKSIADVAAAVISRIATTTGASVESGLRKAIDNNLIAKKYTDALPKWLEQYAALQAQEAVKEGSSSSARTILEASGVPAQKQQTLLQAYVEGGSHDEIVRRLTDSEQFTPEEITGVQATLVLHNLILGDAALIMQFRKQITKPEDARTLARMSAVEWEAAITQARVTPPNYVAGATAEEKTRNYSTLLAQRQALAYPTAALAGAMARAIGAQQKVALKNAGQIVAFFEAHPDFELATTSIDGYLKHKAQPAFFNAAQNNGVLTELKAVQRTFKLTTNFDAANSLLQAGLHSAQQIYRLGESQFVNKFSSHPGFTETLARQTFQRAANTYGTVITIIGELRATQNANQIQGVANAVPALNDFPDLENLFGQADSCACDECQSIFSPAAYLADLLKYLEGRQLGLQTAKDVLFSRRPDIGYIELTCANSNTPLPYIDLTCEVLEGQVAPWPTTSLPVTLLPDLVEGPPDANIQNAFAGATPSITLTEAARISARDHFNHWLIHDVGATYLVRELLGNLAVSKLRQTHGTEEERSAIPEYVNDAAYSVLSGAKYPLALPFDLFTAEARDYLKRVNVNRSDLMEAFRGPNAPNNPADLEIASEYLGIAPGERDLILQADTLNQHVYWGENDNPSAIAALSKVNVFLQRTGLEYADLLRLLSLSFVNPGGAILMQHLDASCDTSQKRLQVLDINALDRIHRFLRLWRKLSWKMWEVNLVIQFPALGHGFLDGNLALKLYVFMQLKDRFPNLTVEQLCVLFGDMNVLPKYTQAYADPEPSLYQQLFLKKPLNAPTDADFAVNAVTAGTPAATIDDSHLPRILAAIKIKQSDFAVFANLAQPGNGPAYIDNKLSLKNLSFLYRHALLAKTLGMKATDWKTLLFLAQADPFASTDATLNFVSLADRIRQSGFTVDQLEYILTADLSAKSAATDKSASATLTTLQKALQAIFAANDPGAVPITVDALNSAVIAQLQTLGWDASSASDLINTLNNTILLRRIAAGVPAAFFFPSAITNSVPVAYDGASHAIRFTGVMTDTQKNTLLNDVSLPATVKADVTYQAAINDIYATPRLLMKFYLPRFQASLAVLPPTVQFTALPTTLAARVQYDTAQNQLSFFGIMTVDEQGALNGLAGDVPYHNAVQSLFTQPRTGTFAANELWLDPSALQFPLAPSPADDPASVTHKAAAANLLTNLTLADTRLLTYMRRKFAKDAIVQQLSSSFGLTQVIIDNLLATYQLGGIPLLAGYLDSSFVNAASALSSDAFPVLFQNYRLLHRLSLILKTLAITYDDLQWIQQNHSAASIADFQQFLTKFNTATPPPVTLSAFLDLADFMQLQHTYWQQDRNILAIVDRLIHDPAYTNSQFAADVEEVIGWAAADVQWLTAAANLDIAYPAAYQAINGWQRLSRILGILSRLSSSASSTAAFASGTAFSDPMVAAKNSAALKQLVRSNFDEQSWLGLNKEIQNSLRERKRDALVAYLLTQPMPVDASTQKWTDANDLFAYYLIDVEMSACQPTSRVVQASAAAQFLVQRSLMGLEPKVRASVDDDGGWAQWDWMKYYRLWEANRRVFAYPENYAEPELRKDKSELFQNLENELQQNEVTRDNVENAFIHYLEGLDDVAQLEVAGTYYQESTRTLHVVGRTAGADPHLYYYRQFINGRTWTGWTKITADIKANYVVPLVANERLHLVWPEFQDEMVQPSSAKIPSSSDQNHGSTSVDAPLKTRKLYLAVTEYKSGKWTPKKISQDYLDLGKSTDDDFHPEFYSVFPLDLTWLPTELFSSNPPPRLPSGYDWLVKGAFLLEVCQTDPSSQSSRQIGQFELAGCRGYPEQFQGFLHLRPIITRFERDDIENDKNLEQSDSPSDALTPIPGTNLVLWSEILGNTPDRFKITYPQYMSYFDRLIFLYFLITTLILQQHFSKESSAFARVPERLRLTLGTFYDWFYSDKLRTFHVRPEILDLKNRKTLFYEDMLPLLEQVFTLIAQDQWLDAIEALKDSFQSEYAFNLLFRNFYHPLTCLFAKQLYQKGVEGLMARETQLADRQLDFAGDYLPTWLVDRGRPAPSDPHPAYPKEVVDFAPDASYSIYNWELFFHAPLMIGERLSQNQKFEDAMRWYQFIFDPTGAHDKDPITHLPVSAPQKYWITKPFYQRQSADYLQQRIENLMQLLANDPSNPPPPALLEQLQKQVQDWRDDPFDPHMVAQYRTVAYQKLTVMKYIDNLIAWGDQLFEMDTLESVNEATQLYVVAAEILGSRPQIVSPAARPVPQTFNELDDNLDAFSNALIDFENLIPPMPSQNGGGSPQPPIPSLLYFCIPQNDQLLKYWDTVEDRLYKIRHCLNIQGIFSPPALFAPPIDVLALVKAAAAGESLSSALADLNAPLPHYRFTTMLQKANEFTNDVKALGAGLLSALEKKDSESLALLRQNQEIGMLQAILDVKQKQAEDAQLTIDGLQKSLDLANIRQNYYSTRDFLNAGEITAMSLSIASTVLDAGIAVGYILSGGLKLIPQFMAGAAGFGGSPTVEASMGGSNIGDSAEEAVKTISSIATALEKGASIASTVASYQRRMDDWQFQLRLANKEIEQIGKQIDSARKKYDIAMKEVDNQNLQIANAQAVNDFMQTKYTDQELYNWMIGQISQTYFQAYQVAYDLAKRAERCYRYELGVDDSSFIQFGYWQSLRNGLQSGERLQLDLRRLESAYLDQNRREFENTKHISLSLLNPQALLDLKDKGICTFQIPEELFDLDFPGQYFRRIKSVGLSVPCVAGPHTTVNATLRLLKNMVRINSSGAQYEHNNDSGVFTDDDRFRESHVRANAIAASSGQSDSGMFELNFRDERYLPFEGAGVISTWQLELSQERDLRQFSYDTISDVLLHVRYTAREDTGPFRDSAVSHLKDVLANATSQMPSWRIFDLLHEFPTEWYAFFHPAGGGAKVLQLNLRKGKFPLLAQNKTIQIESVTIAAQTTFSGDYIVQIDPPLGTQDADLVKLKGPANPKAFHEGTYSGASVPFAFDETQTWMLRMRQNPGTFDGLTADEVKQCFLVIQYTLH